jgi:hypothetical protein
MTTEEQNNGTMPTPPDLTKISSIQRLKIRCYSAFTTFIKLKVDKEKFWINFFVGLAFFSIVVGLIIFFIFFLMVGKHYTISADNIEFDKTGQVGDFIGGIVGAIWSLTGVLLFYATLRLQSRELRENRVHFQLSRLTDIIYKQLEMFNKHLDQFTLKDLESENGRHKEYQGRFAVVLLTRRLEAIRDVGKKASETDDKEAMTIFIGENFAFIEINKAEFLKIYEELTNQIDTIRAILIKEDIPPIDLNELKGIFFRNIGREFLNSSELLLIIIDWYIDFKKKNETSFNEFWSVEGSIKTKIESIISFRQKHFDKETIKKDIAGRELYNIHYF